MRSLEPSFLSDLHSGILAPLAEKVRSDSSLCLELRGSRINVYYRGANLMEVKELANGYSAKFDKEYFKNAKATPLPERVPLEDDDIAQWLSAWPHLKQAIDRYLTVIKSNHEREFQQLIVRENNFGRVSRPANGDIQYAKRSIARSTDYFVCDIEYEYAIPAGNRRFDLVAAHWPSNRHVRKDAHDRRLVLVEMKYGDAALAGDAGLHEHIKDANAFLSEPGRVNDLETDMVRVFNQKRRLGLVDCGKDLAGFSDEQPMLLLVLANHDPGSTKLRDVLTDLPASPNADLRLATASFFGYGLYDQGVHTIDAALRRLGDYVYEDLPGDAAPA